MLIYVTYLELLILLEEFLILITITLRKLIDLDIVFFYLIQNLKTNFTFSYIPVGLFNAKQKGVGVGWGWGAFKVVF